MQINPVSHPHAPVSPLYLFLFGSFLPPLSPLPLTLKMLRVQLQTHT